MHLEIEDSRVWLRRPFAGAARDPLLNFKFKHEVIFGQTVGVQSRKSECLGMQTVQLKLLRPSSCVDLNLVGLQMSANTCEMWSAILSDPGGESMLMTFAVLYILKQPAAHVPPPSLVQRTSHGLLLRFGARLLPQAKEKSPELAVWTPSPPLPSLTESAATGRLYICKGGHHVCISEQTRSAL